MLQLVDSYSQKVIGEVRYKIDECRYWNSKKATAISLKDKEKKELALLKAWIEVTEHDRVSLEREIERLKTKIG